MNARVEAWKRWEPPEIARKHSHPLVRETMIRFRQAYERRAVLGTPFTSNGAERFPALNELLWRPPRHKRGCKFRSNPRGDGKQACDCPRGDDFSGRRADHMHTVLDLLAVEVATMEFATGELVDPQMGGNLSVARHAELAGLPVEPRWDENPRRRNRKRMTCTERGMRTISETGWRFTKQWREQQPNGSHRTTGPALRRLSGKLFERLGLGRLYHRTVEAARQKKRTELDKLIEEGRIAPPPESPIPEGLPVVVNAGAAPASSPVHVGGKFRSDDGISDEVFREHPEWKSRPHLIFAEADRRRRERAPPGGSSGEPPSSN